MNYPILQALKYPRAVSEDPSWTLGILLCPCLGQISAASALVFSYPCLHLHLPQECQRPSVCNKRKLELDMEVVLDPVYSIVGCGCPSWSVNYRRPSLGIYLLPLLKVWPEF